MFWTAFSFILGAISDLFSLVFSVDVGGITVGTIIGGMLLTAFAVWFLKLLIAKT